MLAAAASAPGGRGAQGRRSGPRLHALGQRWEDLQASDFKGKKAVVLAWFPKAFTQGCTIECKSLAANGDKLRQYQVAYFMASVDPMEGEKGNKAFAESEKADFPMLGDPTKETAAAYGVLHPERGFAQRWTFYIDKDGKIAAVDKAVKPPTSAEDVLAHLQELRSPRFSSQRRRARTCVPAELCGFLPER